MKGRLVGSDCSQAPGAIISIRSGTTIWKLHAKNTAHIVVLGADNFSCDWKDRNVAVNYRDDGAGNGELVSIELE
jgi:hypothetical protein